MRPHAARRATRVGATQKSASSSSESVESAVALASPRRDCAALANARRRSSSSSSSSSSPLPSKVGAGGFDTSVSDCACFPSSCSRHAGPAPSTTVVDEEDVADRSRLRDTVACRRAAYKSACSASWLMTRPATWLSRWVERPSLSDLSLALLPQPLLSPCRRRCSRAAPLLSLLLVLLPFVPLFARGVARSRSGSTLMVWREVISSASCSSSSAMVAGT
mmetsp:Transcript_14274/g.40388  ORF Transcript_14274/g.40388 Transcript_14274/m.40388 type:complete len:220 (+) Transcript_14274:243-902(+)